MSLKDAIREAAGERDKKDNGLQEVIEDAVQPEKDVADTASSKAVYTARSKAAKATPSKTTKPALKPKAVLEMAVADETADGEIELAALTVRVPRNSRIHWLVSAKKQNTTLTAAIIEALNERFGAAED